MFPKIGVPQNGWFIREKPIKMDDLGVPLFLETPTSTCSNFLGRQHAILSELSTKVDCRAGTSTSKNTSAEFNQNGRYLGLGPRSVKYKLNIYYIIYKYLKQERSMKTMEVCYIWHVQMTCVR